MVVAGYRYQNITYEMAQQTLRFMTKLDRAIDNGERLKELSEFYASQNISSLDLFHLLKLVGDCTFFSNFCSCIHLIYLMFKTAPNCNDMVLDCIWQGLPAPCNDYLSFCKYLEQIVSVIINADKIQFVVL